MRACARRLGRSLLLGLLAVGLLGAAGPRKSPPRDEAMTRRKIQTHLDLSAELFRSGDYQGALTGLERAAALTSLAVVRFNIARCLEKLGRADEAISAYEQYLALRDTTPGAEDRARRSREIIAGLEPRVFSVLRIDCAVPGSQVAVPGILEGTKPCPLHRSRVRPGKYAVAVSSGGSVYFTDEVTVRLGELAVIFANKVAAHPAPETQLAAQPAAPPSPNAPAKPPSGPMATSPDGRSPSPDEARVATSADAGKPRHWSFGLRGQVLLASPLGGAGAALVGYQPSPSWRFSAGAMIAGGTTLGALATLSVVPFNAAGSLRPVLSLEVPVLFASRVRTGVGGAAALELAVSPGLSFSLEVPAYYFPGAAKNEPSSYAFASVRADVRF